MEPLLTGDQTNARIEGIKTELGAVWNIAKEKYNIEDDEVAVDFNEHMLFDGWRKVKEQIRDEIDILGDEASSLKYKDSQLDLIQRKIFELKMSIHERRAYVDPEASRKYHIKKIVIIAAITVFVILLIVALIIVFGTNLIENFNPAFLAGMDMRSDHLIPSQTASTLGFKTDQSHRYNVIAADIPLLSSKLGREGMSKSKKEHMTKRHELAFNEDQLENYQNYNVQAQDAKEDGEESSSEDSTNERMNVIDRMVPSPKVFSRAERFPGPQPKIIDPPHMRSEYPWAHMSCMNPHQ